jgi:hypothetical protein
MAGRNDGSPGRWARRPTPVGWSAERAGPGGPGGPWQWSWRRRHRWRRRTGCLLWVLTLVIVLLVLSLLFGGFRTGTRVGNGGAHVLRPAVAAAGFGTAGGEAGLATRPG